MKCFHSRNVFISPSQLGELQTFEIPIVIILCSENWTPESGLMTSEMNQNRRKIHEYYVDDID